MAGSLLGRVPVAAPMTTSPWSSVRRSGWSVRSTWSSIIPPGRSRVAQFLEMRVFDVTVHAWDLARAVEGDEHLDDALASVVLDIVVGMPDPGLGFGIVPLGTARAGDPPLARLLDLSGRRP